MLQRLVLLGWTDDARDLLYVHSDIHSTEERYSIPTKVLVSSLVLMSFFWCLPSLVSAS